MKKIKDAAHKSGDFNGTCGQGYRLSCDLAWCVDDKVLKSVFISLTITTGRNEVVAKVMFLLVSVILLTGEGGSGIPPSSPQEGGTPPPPPRDTVNELPVRILLESILVAKKFPWLRSKNSVETYSFQQHILFQRFVCLIKFRLQGRIHGFSQESGANPIYFLNLVNIL